MNKLDIQKTEEIAIMYNITIEEVGKIKTGKEALEYAHKKWVSVESLGRRADKNGLIVVSCEELGLKKEDVGLMNSNL